MTYSTSCFRKYRQSEFLQPWWGPRTGVRSVHLYCTSLETYRGSTDSRYCTGVCSRVDRLGVSPVPNLIPLSPCSPSTSMDDSSRITAPPWPFQVLCQLVYITLPCLSSDVHFRVCLIILSCRGVCVPAPVIYPGSGGGVSNNHLFYIYTFVSVPCCSCLACLVLVLLGLLKNHNKILE